MQSQRVQIKINKLTRTLGGDLKETVSTLRPQPPSPLVFLFLIKPMWRPATRQITGTNDGALEYFLCNIRFCHFIVVLVPLGTRRRFGPAPAEETAPPQLAQPSPSAYPRPAQNDHESPSKRGREESPGSGDPKGKLICIN
jgi:hypothetical protein